MILKHILTYLLMMTHRFYYCRVYRFRRRCSMRSQATIQLRISSGWKKQLDRSSLNEISRKTVSSWLHTPSVALFCFNSNLFLSNLIYIYCDDMHNCTYYYDTFICAFFKFRLRHILIVDSYRHHILCSLTFCLIRLTIEIDGTALSASD